MTKSLALAAALTLFAATGALAQAAQSSSGSTMMKQTPKSDAAGMSAQSETTKSDASTDADASAAKPKAHHRMARNEAQLNEQEAETTRQLNEQQAQYAQNPK
jgi:hypothetical protein